MSGSKVVQRSSFWTGFPHIKRLMIFGDSYSDCGYDLAFSVRNELRAVPTALEPMGVEWPGVRLWNEPELPNWVGHLLTKYCPGPRYKPSESHQDQAYLDNPLLAYNFARGGDTVDGVYRQIQRLFLPELSKKLDRAPWNAENTLFVTWVGINDCAYRGDAARIVEKLFVLQQDLYEVGARNFLFIDLPPVDKTPAVCHSELMTESVQTTYAAFNEQLIAGATKFANAHSDSTVLFYSSRATFLKFLDDPVEYGFTEEDCGKRDGPIWYDHLHPTSKVHDFVAKDLAEFLSSVA